MRKDLEIYNLYVFFEKKMCFYYLEHYLYLSIIIFTYSLVLTTSHRPPDNPIVSFS